MAQLKDTTVTGDIAISGSATIGGGAEITGGDLDLYVGTGDSPAVIFKRGTLTDNYNDWRIQDRGGWFYVDERGANSTTWTNRLSINTTGIVTANTFNGAVAWDNVTNKPALTVSDITTGTDETNKLVSAKTLADTLGGLGGGTITGVTAGTGLSGGGTSGGVTLNHSNSVTAQNTQAVYPIKIDAQGHISSYGSAVTIPTVPSAGTTASAVGTSSSGGSATTWSKSDHVHSISGTTITNALGYTPYNSTNPDGYITANDVPKENFIVTVTLTSLTGGTSDKTSDEIAAAASAGKLPVVVTQYNSALLVAPLSWILISSDPLESSIAYFTYEDQSNENIPYATMRILGDSVVLGFRNQYLTEITSTDVTNALGYTPYNSSNPNGYITSSSIPTAGTTATAVSTTASGGSATTWSKSDHVHSISSSTITSALGFTPYNSTNPDGYLTSSTLSGALQANTALIYELIYHEAVWDFGHVTPAYYTIADTLANVVANISSDRKVIFRQSLDTGKYNYWQPWFNNPNSNKIGLYRFEKDDAKLYHVVFEPDDQGTGLTGTEVNPYYLNQHDPYAVGKIITTSSISDDPNDYLDGTWTLIDKEFTPLASTQLDSNAITLNTTNADGLDLYFSRTGHEIAFTGYLSSKVNISNTNLEMVQSITLSSLGATAFNFTPILNAQSDSKHAIILMDMDKSSGRIRTLDVVVRGTSTSIAATSDIAFQAVVTCHYTDMLDSACSKFYWKRTA